MADRPISRFEVGSLDGLPEDVRARVERIAERSGFVPNVFIAMAHRPDELRAFMDYHDALMERDSGLTKAEREMIVVATSAANECLYCVVAHGAILRVRAKDSELADRIAANWRTAPVTGRQRAMLAFAVKLARRPEEIGDEDLDALRRAGFDDSDIWDIGSITAFFALSNRIAHLADLQPNPEFFALGR
ncbi:MAG TPA: peroxidase-related enzyme [Acidimicrobiia bacterium]|nr:peroxidase-related enzyme [Acidimicrobiia bacterium]